MSQLKEIDQIRMLPKTHAVYALYGGKGKREYVAYVGVANNLRGRAEQHLVKHDSSATTGQSAVKLETQYLSKLKWWEDERFDKREKLEAAELVASDVLKPVLVSRGNPRKDSVKLFKDEIFYNSIKELLRNPSGVLILLSTEDRMQMLEKRIARLEESIRKSIGN